MPFQIIRNDITKVRSDIIVNTANPFPIIGDGVDRAIYTAAGEEKLLEARKQIGIISEGDVAITPAFELQAKYIIHASGPWYEGGDQGEADKLRSCYKKSLELAVSHDCKSIAFPFLSTGSYGFPRDEALGIAISVFSQFLMKHDLMIYLVVFDKESVHITEKFFTGLDQYIDENYVTSTFSKEYLSALPRSLETPEPECSSIGRNIELDMSFIDNEAMPFTEYLQQLINKKGMTNSEVYSNSDMDKKYFSKLINGKINPPKLRVLSLAIGMKLNLDETKDLLTYAGYALAPNNKSDLIFQYYISKGKYDIYEIDIALFEHGQQTLVEEF